MWGHQLTSGARRTAHGEDDGILGVRVRIGTGNTLQLRAAVRMYVCAAREYDADAP